MLPGAALAQTPEQQQLWDAQRAQSVLEEQKKSDQRRHEREQRKADPMAWVRTLNPMPGGGWEFRTVADDGSWAMYTTTHQMKKAGRTVTVWLRREYAEVQVLDDRHYQSMVEKVQYDCAKQQERALLLIYYSSSNVQGSEEIEQADPKTTEWNPIVPGTSEEVNFAWACDAAKLTGRP